MDTFIAGGGDGRTHVYIAQTHQALYIKYVQPLTCQLYLNEGVQINKKGTAHKQNCQPHTVQYCAKPTNCVNCTHACDLRSREERRCKIVSLDHASEC